MAVIANLRNLSRMEYYKNAMRIRTEITKWIMRDFGTKKNPKDIKHTIADITEDEEKIINEIFVKHGKSTKKEFQSVYPEWFTEVERKYLIDIMWQMMCSIISANSVYPEIIAEYNFRRVKIDEAIAAVHQLYYELDYISRVFPQNLNFFEPLLDALEKEDHLLKGWRQSDNKSRKKLEEKLKCA